MTNRSTAARVMFLLVLVLALAQVSVAAQNAAVSDFAFLQLSDVHTPQKQSPEVIALAKSIAALELAAYGVVAPRPDFAIVTGDLTEFGGGSGCWEQYMAYWNDCPYPVYQTTGNHDNTWYACVRKLRLAGQKPCYSFDHKGCHFVALTTATVQDPRPSIGEEQIRWLQDDLKRVGPTAPVFVFFHHPLGGTEFASRYDYDRLLDILSDYNTVLLMAGHSHGYVHRPFEGWDQITGGTTFADRAGMMYVAVQDRVLRTAYRTAAETTATVKILEKPIPETAPYPRVEIVSPKPGESLGAKLAIRAGISGNTSVDKAVYTIDDDLRGDLALTGTAPNWTAEGTVDIGQIAAGAHYLRVTFSGEGGQRSRSTQFFVEPPTKPTAWRAYLGSAGKSAPTAYGNTLYVAANDGILRAMDCRTGAQLWSVDTGSEILAQPLVADRRVYVANGIGQVAAYTLGGRRVWTFEADDSVYSSPVFFEGRIIFGCSNGKLYAVDASNGSLAWTNEDATYTIESKPFIHQGRVYYGAWDQYVRCVDAATGKLVWKQMGEGSRVQAAKRYFSPADCGPVVVGGKLLVADRDYYLTILDAASGEPVSSIKGVSAVCASEDGAHAYLRKTTGELVKIDPSGVQVWSVPAQLDAIPTPPLEKNGTVYVASRKGLVSAVSASSGELLWQYQASPQLFVMAPLECDGTNVYVVAFDGHLTAVRCEQRSADTVAGK